MSRVRFTTLAGKAALVSTVGLLLGCTVGAHYHPPSPPSVGIYTREQPTPTVASAGPAGGSQHFNPTADIPAEWWTLFRSPALDRTVREALTRSPTLAQATARLTEAQEEVNARAGSAKYPTVTGNASAQREQVNLASFGVPFPNPKPFTLLNGSVGVSYALDLFGANRRLIEGLRAQAAYEEWQLQGARLMLAGNVVSTAIRQAQLSSQLDTTEKILAAETMQLEITEKRYRAGGISLADVQSQRTTVAQTTAQLPVLEQELDATDHQLAVLMGQTPAEAHIERVKLEDLKLPEELPLTIPSELVRQRPDILASESLLHEASANVGVATANLYPQVTLSGYAGGTGTKFDSGGGIWNVEAALTQPIYNGGRLRAEKRKAIADYQEAEGAYRETVVQAFREVADTLRAIEHDAAALHFNAEATKQAEENYRIASERFKSGGISEIARLDAQRQWLQTLLSGNVAAANRYTDSATLFQALGGGWWKARPSAGPR